MNTLSWILLLVIVAILSYAAGVAAERGASKVKEDE